MCEEAVLVKAVEGFYGYSGIVLVKKKTYLIVL